MAPSAEPAEADAAEPGREWPSDALLRIVVAAADAAEPDAAPVSGAGSMGARRNAVVALRAAAASALASAREESVAPRRDMPPPRLSAGGAGKAAVESAAVICAYTVEMSSGRDHRSA